MIEQTITLSKMQTFLSESNMAQYQLGELKMNALIGKRITLKFLGEINCVACGRSTKKSFNQGYCFPCLRSLAECDTCIIKPELCHYHEGTCRDSSWGKAHCIKPHYIYLANTAVIKVGITREKNIPSRWIDQGATQALPIVQVSERLLSGLIEVKLAQHVTDKTNWQAMLKSSPDQLDLLDYKNKILAKEQHFIDALKEKYSEASIKIVKMSEQQIHYPVLEYPNKIQAHNLDKSLIIEGLLMGMKGQYVILDTGVMNVRKFAGYKCQISIQ